jgi:3-phytase
VDAGWIAIGAVVTACGCAAAVDRPLPSAPRSEIPALQLLAAAVTPATPITPDVDRARLFGSVSGLARDPATGRYLAVIDDRQPARVAWLDIRYQSGSLAVSVVQVEPLTAGPGVDERLVTGADLEAVALLPDGTFAAAEEGHVTAGPPGRPPIAVWPLALLLFPRSLVVTATVPFPDAFDVRPDGPGARDNQGAESLTITPDGRLVAGLEQPRRPDMPSGTRRGRPFSEGRGGPTRLVEFVRAGAGWRAARQWMYLLDQTRSVAGYDRICDDGENGLAELLALDDTTFLSIERACLQNSRTLEARNTATIHHVSVAGADDVSDIGALDPARVRGARKTLVLDFDTLIPDLPAELSRLENFEALAFGPDLPDGSRTVLVVSDDNFRATQKTAFLLFRVSR